jgi:hypothetical protein
MHSIILYKYPNSSNIYEAKIWRGKQICDWVAMLWLSKHDYSLKDQDLKVVANVNAYLNLEEKKRLALIRLK